MAELKMIIDSSDSNPNSMKMIRDTRAVLSREIIWLEETLGYLNEAAHSVEIPPEPPEQSGRALYDRLRIHVYKEQICLRVVDLKKNMTGCRHNLEVLAEMANIVSETKMFRLQDAVAVNTRNLCNLQESTLRSSNALEVMQVVIGGSLAFDIMDRLTGQWSVVNTLWFKDAAQSLLEQNATVWFFINMIAWVVVAAVVIKSMQRMQYRSQGEIKLRIKVNAKLDPAALKAYLGEKDLRVEHRAFTVNNSVCTVGWQEPSAKDWGGSAPRITLRYDEATNFMLDMTLQYARRTANKKMVFNSKELKMTLLTQMRESGVLLDEDED
eukprot:g4691.t1